MHKHYIHGILQYYNNIPYSVIVNIIITVIRVDIIYI